MKDTKFEIWRNETMIGAVTVIDGVVEEDRPVVSLSLSLTDWDKTVDGLATIVEAKLGHTVTIRTPWEGK